MYKRLILMISIITVIFLPYCAYANVMVTLEWNQNTQPDTVGYNVYQRTSNTIYDYSSPANTSPIPATQTITQIILSKSDTYYFVVKCFDDCNRYSIDSNEVYIVVDVTASYALPPTNVTIIKITKTPYGYEVLLNWIPSADTNVVGYSVYQRYENANYDYNTPIISNIMPMQSYIILPPVTMDGTYSWIARSFDDQGRYGNSSNEVTAIIDSNTWPIPVTGLTITKIENVP